jgi:sec-independent protein translocase protein TatB
MFNVGGGEVLVILLVALVVLGPDKLPGAMRSVGNVVGEMRKLSNGFQSEMRNAMYSDDRPPSSGPATGGGQPTDQGPPIPPAAPDPPSSTRRANDAMFRPPTDPADAETPSLERPTE